jgi:exodeoxyribonuclease V alpha subunit
LAAHGFTLDPDTGEITELSQFVGPFSARAEQIGRNIDRYETEWRAVHPGQEPGAAVRRAWDARAWADARPDKVVPRDGAELTRRWVTELHDLGYRNVHIPAPVGAVPVAHLDRNQAVAEVLSRLASRRSAWNGADIRGQVEQLIARRNIVADASIRCELAEDLTARTLAQCVPLLDRVGVPEHIRALTSRHVLDVEADLNSRLAARADTPCRAHDLASAPAADVAVSTLDVAQRHVVGALCGDRQLVVVEGAAGAGKTTTLAATRTVIEGGGHRLVVVTPTLKAAEVAAQQLGTGAFSAAWLAHQHGYRWNETGSWTRLKPGQSDPATGAVYAGPSERAALHAGDLLLCDEAGMVDQDTARALLRIADQHHARIALLGDRHQLPAVGRGGLLDLALRWVAPQAHLTLDTVHRFTRTATAPDGSAVTIPDEQYARLSLAMRAGDDPAAVFDALLARGQIRVHASDQDRLQACAARAADAFVSGVQAVLVADTRDQVAALNTAVRDRLAATGHVDDTHATTTGSGQRVGAGDRVATRRNNTELGVANRDTWTVTAVHQDGSLAVAGDRGRRILPVGYVHEHVELGYASTVHGVQGDTTITAHMMLGEHSTAASAYVAMTRGRQHNTAHLVAETVEDARAQWVAAFARDRADLGPARAAELAAAEAARYAEVRPVGQVLAELRDAWTVQEDLCAELTVLEQTRDVVADVVELTRRRDDRLPGLEEDYENARAAAATAATAADRVEAAVAGHTSQIAEQLQRDWDSQRFAARHAAQIVHAGPGRFGQRHWAVNRAIDELANWSTRWQPYLPAMPTRSDAIATFASRYDNDPRLHDAFQRYARAVAEQAHPQLGQARAAAAHATGRRDQAWTAWQQTRGHYDLELSRYGRLAYHPDLDGYLTELQDTIPEVRADADAAKQRVQGLLTEPALRTLPAARIEAERDQWRADRTAAQAKAVRELLAGYGRGAERLGLRSPHQPYRAPSAPMPDHTPEHGRGISR